jgi:hypothetical protein
MLSVIMLSVRFYWRYAEYRYAEWRYAKCRYAEFRGALSNTLAYHSRI